MSNNKAIFILYARYQGIHRRQAHSPLQIDIRILHEIRMKKILILCCPDTSSVPRIVTESETASRIRTSLRRWKWIFFKSMAASSKGIGTWKRLISGFQLSTDAGESETPQLFIKAYYNATTTYAHLPCLWVLGVYKTIGGARYLGRVATVLVLRTRHHVL